MNPIRNYTDTKCELDIAKSRLNFLIEKKEELYSKYFPLTSSSKEVNVTNGSHTDDEMMIKYIQELYEVDFGTGKSLAEEIESEQKRVKKTQSYLDMMDDTLSKMKGIEYQLYYEIVITGTPITKAIENVAEKNDIDERSVWRNYKNIKKYIKKLKMSVICQ